MELNGKYILSDIESGEYREVSKQEHDAYFKFIAELSKMTYEVAGIKGKIILVGTSGENESQNFESLWNKRHRL